VRTVESFPRVVREIENVWIPMPDGCRLAARIWLPEDAESDPVPGILEYIPYRKRDLTAGRDVPHHGYVAGHGYACVRVDLRGSGESDGVLTDEYLPLELEDGVAVIHWIASQPWCTGAVGMVGISWGGFNGLQIAALQPEALRAVVSICSTDDRYADDVHYMGGCLLAENLSWASHMFAHNACPPDPAIVGERWREMWLERLEGSGLWLETWLRHQRRDAYWEHGSVCEDHAAIRCPVYAVSGWADGYSNAVFRLLEQLDVQVRGLVGPWAHLYPHQGVPGPAIGFLQEMLRWWDRWLKDVPNGIEREPALHAWVQDPAPPRMHRVEAPGRWVAVHVWPREHPSLRFTLAPGRLAPAGEDVAETPLELHSPLGVGLRAGKWCAYGVPPDLPPDQRPDDDGSLVFDGAPLEDDLEILGAPVATLALASDQPLATIAVRLCDVHPDGQVERVSYGLLNLAHRDGHAAPVPLEPGRRYRVEVRLNDAGWRFPAGHRLRLAVSSTYWPLAWPAPVPATLALHAGASTLALPGHAAGADRDAPAAFAAPEAGPPLATTVLRPARHERVIREDAASGETVLEVLGDDGAWRLDEVDLEVEAICHERYAHRGDDPLAVRGETEWLRGFRRGEWRVRSVTRTVLTASAAEFRIRATLEGFEGEERVYARDWDVTVPRDHL